MDFEFAVGVDLAPPLVVFFEFTFLYLPTLLIYILTLTQYALYMYMYSP